MSTTTLAQVVPQWAADIKIVRTRIGESQAVFGARFGVGKQAVSQWESGQSEPPVRVIIYMTWQHNPELKPEYAEDIDWTRKQAPAYEDENGFQWGVLKPEVTSKHVHTESCVFLPRHADHRCDEGCDDGGY